MNELFSNIDALRYHEIGHYITWLAFSEKGTFNQPILINSKNSDEANAFGGTKYEVNKMNDSEIKDLLDKSPEFLSDYAYNILAGFALEKLTQYLDSCDTHSSKGKFMEVNGSDYEKFRMIVTKLHSLQLTNLKEDEIFGYCINNLRAFFADSHIWKVAKAMRYYLECNNDIIKDLTEYNKNYSRGLKNISLEYLTPIYPITHK